MILAVEAESSLRYWALDFDAASGDEFVVNHRDTHLRDDVGPDASYVFADGAGVTVDQTNYVGVPQPPHALDVTGDGVPEVLVPLLRNDSLFLSIASNRGQKIGSLLLMTGEPRPQPDGDLPWDPYVAQMWLIDLDGDDRGELVSVVSTAFARLPRGLLVHDPATGEKLGEVIVGAAPVALMLEDFDGNGIPELLAGTMISLHGADAGGLQDSLSYLMLYELAPTPRVAWSRVSQSGYPELSKTDIDGDGDLEILSVQSGFGPTVVEVLDPQTWTVLRRRTLQGPGQSAQVIDLDRDPNPEVVTVAGRSIRVIDDDLESVRIVPSPVDLGNGETWPDLDGDDIEELAFSTPDGFVLLDPSLGIKAMHRGGQIYGIQRRGIDVPPLVLIENGAGTLFAELRVNPWYWFYRYGAPFAVVFSVVALGLLWVGLGRSRHRRALASAVNAELLRGGGRTLLLLDRRRTLLWVHPKLQPMPDWKRGRASIDILSQSLPALWEFCARIVADRPPREHTTRLAVPTPEGLAERRVHATPILTGSRRDPHWMVREQGDRATNLELDGPWPLMAQRVAHRLKNSLSHMLLTIQRLQAEYQDRAPAVAHRLDVYSDRIQDGIGQLRRDTSNFLKLVDVDEPDLAEVDVNEVVREFARGVRRRIPPDIRVVEDLAPRLPRVVIDREQIEEALENLVSNAVNATGVGGTVTLTTADCRGLALSGDLPTGDAIAIEVLDTGHGVPVDLRDRLFDSGTSAREDGTGLGLAIVHKIARDHGGQVTFHSEEGVGTVFTLRLPITGPAAADVRHGSQAGP